MKPLVADNPLRQMPETLATVVAMEFLRALGWRCEEPSGNGEEFEVGELAQILEVPASTIMVRLRHPGCPPARRRLGPKGRLLSIVMTKELEEWLARPKQAGRKLQSCRPACRQTLASEAGDGGHPGLASGVHPPGGIAGISAEHDGAMQEGKKEEA